MNPKSHNLLLGLLFLLSFGPGACAPKPPQANPEAPYPPPHPPAVGDILHLPTGVFVTEEQMLAVAAAARIVYVGETHDNPASHRLELAVLRAMAERYPGKVALGMEMFTPAQQDALDRWVAGKLSEKEFLKASRWYDVWRMDFDYYRDLLLFARERSIPVIGLNAEKSLVRAAGRQELEDLPEEERAKLPEMDFSDPYQRALVEAIYGGHEKGGAMLEGFLRVQTLWDETMAQNVAGYLAGKEDRRMVVLAGGNHVRFGFGIPRRVFRRLPSPYVLVGSREIVISEEKQDRLMDVRIPSFPMPPYDFLVYTEYEDLGKQEVKLGILLEEEDGRLLAKGVLHGSNAEAAGIREGDILLRFDGVSLTESFDLIYEVKRKQPGDRATLVIERDGKPLEVEITFHAPGEESRHGK